MPSGPRETIYGRNAAYEIIRAGRRRVHRLILAEGVVPRGRLLAAVEEAKARGIPLARSPRAELDRASENHHGAAVVADPYPYVDVEEILEAARLSGDPAFILILDALQDPQNLGTLLRTAEAVGVHGVVIPRRQGVGVTEGVVRSSAGACEHLRIAAVNLAQAIRGLKEAGIWVLGLTQGAEAEPLEAADLGGPLALVIGSEGEGLRRLVRELCDGLVRVPMRGQVESLNAAVAGSVALYAAWRARGYGGTAPGQVSD
jgi:23S rRNA (guanosine2251-2'-O)-methyltransferase